MIFYSLSKFPSLITLIRYANIFTSANDFRVSIFFFSCRSQHGGQTMVSRIAQVTWIEYTMLIRVKNHSNFGIVIIFYRKVLLLRRLSSLSTKSTGYGNFCVLSRSARPFRYCHHTTQHHTVPYRTSTLCSKPIKTLWVIAMGKIATFSLTINAFANTATIAKIMLQFQCFAIES